MGLQHVFQRSLALALAATVAAMGCRSAPSTSLFGRHASPDSRLEAVLGSEEDPRSPIGATNGNITKLFLAARGVKVDLTSKAVASFEDDGLSEDGSVDVKWESDHQLLVSTKHMRMVDGIGTWQSGN